MTTRVAINGFGRIGRLVCRNLSKYQSLELVAINDVVDAEQLAYLLKYDSTHGQFPGEITAEEGALMINGKRIKVFAERDPTFLPWRELGVEFVVESTGLFTAAESVQKHLDAGAQYVVITAPAKGEIPTYVMGVNHEQFDPSQRIVSNASCTTNCLAIVTKVLLDHFGIEEGLMTTVHAVTATQPTVDSPSKKDWRGGRGAGLNIIPASTGAAKAVSQCLPEVKGKLTGMAFRVPVADVSVVDLTVRLSRPTTYADICKAMEDAAQGELKEYLEYCDEQVVSSDFIGSSKSAIFDRGAGIGLNDRFYKLVAWYDNENGYAQRVVDLVQYMAWRVGRSQSRV